MILLKNNILKCLLIFVFLWIVINNIECYEGFGKREKTINMLNKDRGMLGQFYVNCYKCGREGILDEYTQYEKVNNNIKNNNICELNDKKMSFYNKKYIDTDMIYCYNCLLDKDTQLFIRNYDNFPYINGTPQTNFFTF